MLSLTLIVPYSRDIDNAEKTAKRNKALGFFSPYLCGAVDCLLLTVLLKPV